MTYYSGPDLARSFRTVRQNTLKIAGDIPERQYAFRATPQTRSVAETLAHIAGLSGWSHRLHGVDKKTFMSFEDFGRYMEETARFEASLKTRAEILSALETTGREYAAWLDTLTDAVLGEVVSFPPPVTPSTKSRFEMILGVKEHEMHHRAQLMVLERLLGLVPHLTVEREARAAARH
jgi:uncharacterized damage-inducible protein DinB